MSKSLRVVVLLSLLLANEALAQPAPPSADWQRVRDQQPKALHIKIALAKDHYYQGEKIDATVEFTNDEAQNAYTVLVGCAEPGATFLGWDTQGHALTDPLQWRNDWEGVNATGPVAFHSIDHYILTRPINENIRFNQPGLCQIYAHASVKQGSDGFQHPDAKVVELVSDPVSVTITPLTPEQEAQAIAAAKQKIGMTDANYDYGNDAGIEELSYLQTPEARAQLIPLLGDRRLAGFAIRGLESAPDPLGEAGHILEAVKKGNLLMDDNGVMSYAELKLASLYMGHHRKDYTEEQAEAIDAQRIKVLESAREEIADAMLQANADGPGHVRALWTAFELQSIYKNPGEPDKDGGKARAAMVAHQLELSAVDAERLIGAWKFWGGADFLPLIRREAKSGSNSKSAEKILAALGQS